MHFLVVIHYFLTLIPSEKEMGRGCCIAGDTCCPMLITRKNYSIEALRFLYQYTYVLPPQRVVQFLYSRFVNVHGLPGHNIAADLHMEHLNAIAKGCVKVLGANKTETAIQRSTKTLGTIVSI